MLNKRNADLSSTHPTGAPRGRRLTVALLVMGIVIAGCGGEQHGGDTGSERSPTSAPSTIGPSQPESKPSVVDASTTETLAVRSSSDLAVFAEPDGAEPSKVLMAHDQFGSPLVLLVTEVGSGNADGWLQVLIPGRPNGATGWVRADDVTINEVDHRVDVDLAARTLTVWDDDQAVLTTPVSIGEPENPTPTGTFSLTDKLDTGDANGPYGPYALGLSGRSEVLTEFGGGDGQVGIHGTNDPTSIGRAASHGCVRVPNDVAAQLSDLLALGTPVTIH